jgi:Ca-activated chloride channel family protein
VRIARDGDAKPAQWLAASWARARIRDLEDRYATGERALESEIVTLSKHHGVLSRFTAFLAVDRAERVNPGGKQHSIVQPVEHPAGWEGGPVVSKQGRRTRAGLADAFAMSPPAQPAPMPSASLPADMLGGAGGMGGLARGAGSTIMGAPGAPPPSNRPVAMPPAPPRPAPLKQRAEHVLERERGIAMPADPVVTTAYLAKLGELARELEEQARRGADAAIRLVRQRLTEWIEDVRSVGGNDELALAVEHQLARLSAAITLGTALAAEAIAVAAELARLAAGAPANPTGPSGKGRAAFWK